MSNKRFWIDTREAGCIYINNGNKHMTWGEVVEKLNDFDIQIDTLIHDNDYLLDLAERSLRQEQRLKQKTLNLIDREIKQIEEAIKNDLNIPSNIDIDTQTLRTLRKIKMEIELYD